MNTKLNLLVVLLFLTACSGGNNSAIFTKLYGYPGASTTGTAVHVDNNSDVIFTGWIHKDFTNGGLDYASDMFIRKLGKNGDPGWQLTYTNDVPQQEVEPSAITTDSQRNIYVVGSTDNDLHGNAHPGSRDYFLIKLTHNGSRLWTKLGGVFLGYTKATGVATDSLGNVFVSGHTNGNLDGNTRTGNSDFFLSKYNSAGTRLWTKMMGVAAKQTEANGVFIDKGDSIYVSGLTTGNLDGETLTGMSGGFIIKYNSMGTKLWTRLIGPIEPHGFCGTNDGDSFIVGQASAGVDGGTLMGNSDLFVAKFDSSGVKKWSRQLGVAGAQTGAIHCAVDPAGAVFLTSSTTGNLDGQISTMTHNAYVAKYDRYGTKIFVRLRPSPAGSIGYGLALDSLGFIFVTGMSYGALDGQPLTGLADAFLIKFNASGEKF